MPGSDRYVIISADCHGGADVAQYRPYLPSRYHQQFDEWALAYPVLHEDLLGEEGRCNWDSDRRLADLEADGIVAEVIYPNTIPPSTPSTRSRCRCPGRPKVTSRPAGPACGPTTSGPPIPAPRPQGAGRASPRSCCTTSTPR